MSNTLKHKVLDANKWIVEKKLVELTWGNVSAIDRLNGEIYIKPSGIILEKIKARDISVIDREGVARSGLKASVDAPTHVVLYDKFPAITSVIHTHSKYCTIFAQAGRDIPCLGTTHADYFYGSVPCVPHPSQKKVEEEYEQNTGIAIYDYFNKNNINYNHTNACLVAGHGVFVWGSTVNKALENAYVLEIIAEMAYKTLNLNPSSNLQQFILDKHFLRKHGKDKYYGQ